MGGDTLLVNGKFVGLVGLDRAVRELLDSRGTALDPKEAAQLLFDKVRGRNYIPPGTESAYLEALERAWLKAAGGDGPEEEGFLVVKILGPGCVSCNRLEEMVKDVLAGLGLAADFEHVTDHDEIWRHGVMQTPALVINGKVYCSGRLPAPAKVEEWIRALTNRV